MAHSWQNAGDQRLAAIREPHRPILLRVRCIALFASRGSLDRPIITRFDSRDQLSLRHAPNAVPFWGLGVVQPHVRRVCGMETDVANALTPLLKRR